MKSTTYRDQNATHAVSLTAKCDGFDEISIKGVRWFGSSNNTTYHIAYLAALVDGKWIELGATEMHTGFADHYLVTAGDWLIKNGYMIAPTGYVLGGWPVREALGITYYGQEVKRKKDL